MWSDLPQTRTLLFPQPRHFSKGFHARIESTVPIAKSGIDQNLLERAVRNNCQLFDVLATPGASISVTEISRIRG